MEILQQMELYMRRYEKLDEAVLKWIALVAMLVDHAALCFLWQTHGGTGYGLALETNSRYFLYSVLRWIGRTAFPVFAFGIAEGCRHTRNPRRYLRRLLVLALVSQLPFVLVCLPSLGAGRNFLQLYGAVGEGHWRLVPLVLSDGWKIMTGQSHAGRPGLRLNTVFTLLCGALGCLLLRRVWPGQPTVPEKKSDPGKSACADFTRGSQCFGTGPDGGTEEAGTDRTGKGSMPRVAGTGRAGWLPLIPTAAALVLLCAAAQWLDMDYGWAGVALILLLYVGERHRLPAVTGGWVLLSLVNASELYSLGGFILIQCYNGKRGKQNALLFYIFYPVHLTVLFLIRFLAAGY